MNEWTKKLQESLDRIKELEAQNQRLLDDAGAEVSRLFLERYEDGAPNYVAMTIGRVEGEDSGVELVVQRTTGKRPSEVAVEMKALLAEALDELRPRMEVRNDGGTVYYCAWCARSPHTDACLISRMEAAIGSGSVNGMKEAAPDCDDEKRSSHPAHDKDKDGQ